MLSTAGAEGGWGMGMMVGEAGWGKGDDVSDGVGVGGERRLEEGEDGEWL